MPIFRLLQSYRIEFAVFVMGFYSLTWQFIVLREMLVVFHGNELTIGIIFGNWLLLEGVGCYYWRKKAESSSRPLIYFVVIQFLVGLLSFLSITLLRAMKYLLSIPTGEMLGIQFVFIVSLIVLAPVSILKGALFPFANRIIGMNNSSSEIPGRVYTVEALGSFGAGLILSLFLLDTFNHISLIVLIIALNLLAVIIIFHSEKKYGRIRNLLTAILIVLISTVIFPFTKWYDKKTSEILWYEYPFIEANNSVYSNIAVIGSDEEYSFFQNGLPVISIPVPPLSVAEKAHIPMLFHPNPKKVLLIGGGAGGLINEVLKHPVSNIKYVEQDPLVIETVEKFSTPLTRNEFSSDKLLVINDEARKFIQSSREKYDVIMINFPVPTTLQLNRFYTLEFFELLKLCLNKNGLITINLPGSETFLTEELEKLNNTIYTTLKKVFSYVNVVIGDVNIFIASDDEVVTADVSMLVKRLDERSIQSDLINKAYLEYKFNRTRYEEIEKTIRKESVSVANSDMVPKSVFQSLMVHSAIVTPELVKFLNVIYSIPFVYYLILLVSTVVVLVLFQLKNKNFLYVDMAILTTGFTSMIVYILLIFLFQIYFGNVYHYAGLLTATFMIGSTLGAYSGMKKPDYKLSLLELYIVLFVALVLAITFLKFHVTVAKIFVFGAMMVNGVLTGFEFPLAVKKYYSLNKNLSLYPGKLYAFDLFGAFLGALLVGVVLVPIVGILSTLIFVLVLKFGSMLVVLLGESKYKFFY